MYQVLTKVKLITIENKIDVRWATPKHATASCVWEISVPTHPTVEEIKTDWDKRIENGELSLGHPSRISVKNCTKQNM